MKPTFTLKQMEAMLTPGQWQQLLGKALSSSALTDAKRGELGCKWAREHGTRGQLRSLFFERLDALSAQDMRAIGARAQDIGEPRPADLWWLSRLEAGELLGHQLGRGERPELQGWPEEAPHHRVWDTYDRDRYGDLGVEREPNREQRPGVKVSVAEFDSMLNRVCPDVAAFDRERETRSGVVTDKWLRLPPLAECREAWERVFGPRDWPGQD